MGQLAQHGADRCCRVIDSAIKSDVLSQLPLIGDLADEGSFFQDLLDVLDTAALALSDTDSFREFSVRIPRAGSNSGTGAKLNILKDVTTIDDIGDFSDLTKLTNAIIDPEDNPSECGRFQLHIGDTLSLPINFDLGLDAIVFRGRHRGRPDAESELRHRARIRPGQGDRRVSWSSTKTTIRKSRWTPA